MEAPSQNSHILLKKNYNSGKKKIIGKVGRRVWPNEAISFSSLFNEPSWILVVKLSLL